jgi:hypothetical protein
MSASQQKTHFHHISQTGSCHSDTSPLTSDLHPNSCIHLPYSIKCPPCAMMTTKTGLKHSQQLISPNVCLHLPSHQRQASQRQANQCTYWPTIRTFHGRQQPLQQRPPPYWKFQTSKDVSANESQRTQQNRQKLLNETQKNPIHSKPN